MGSIKNSNEMTGSDLVEVCSLAQEGLCIEKKWGKCPYPEEENDDGHKCGLCFARYITEKLGYHKQTSLKS